MQVFATADALDVRVPLFEEPVEEEDDDVGEEMDMAVFAAPVATPGGRKRIAAPPLFDAFDKFVAPSIDKPPLPQKVRISAPPPPVKKVRIVSIENFRNELIGWSSFCFEGGAQLGHRTQRRHLLIAYDGEARRCRKDDMLAIDALMTTYRNAMSHLETKQHQELATLSLVSNYLI